MTKQKKPIRITPCANGFLQEREFEKLETKISYAYWYSSDKMDINSVSILCVTVPQPTLSRHYDNLCHCASYLKSEGEHLLKSFGIKDNHAGKLAEKEVIAYFLDGKLSALEPIKQKPARKDTGDYQR